MDPREKTPLKQIRTFQGDIAEALRTQQESLVSIQRAEHLRRGVVGGSAPTAPEDTNRVKRLLFLSLGSIIFIGLGIAGAWFAYNQFLRNTIAPISEAPPNRFLTPNTQVDLKVATTSRETLIKSLSDATASAPAGELRHINLSISTTEFLETLQSRAPGSLVRAFDPLFMFGAIGESTFLIIKVASFENAFAGMLVWEENLAEDIGPLLATAELLRDIPAGPTFTDVTDRNKDARLLRREGQDVLLYSFFDSNMLIITDNIGTLRTLIDRLTREKLSR